MGLLLVIVAVVIATVLSGRVFFEAGRSYVVHLCVLSAMGHHFISVGANKIAFNAMEVRSLVRHRSHCIGV